jgi:dienelactone hydrolase
MVDAVNHAKTLDGVDAARIALVGFSLGGHLCLRLRKEAKLLVEFFAPVLDGLGPSVPLKLQVQIHHGKVDSLVAFDANAEKIAQELRTSGASVTLYSYEGAEHGFVGEDSANQKARAESKERCLNLLETYL